MYNIVNFLAGGITPQTLPLIIAAILVIVPVSIVAIIAFVKVLIKHINRTKKNVETKQDIKNKFIAPFGDDNIVSMNVNMNRVTVEVKDINAVSFDGLRNLGVGVLISGNTVKCSSQEFAKIVSEEMNK